MSPCGDWLRHLHNFHCQPVPEAGETAFDVTVGFDNCEPGQRSVSAILLPAGYLDAHPTTPITELWRVAGPGAYDEVVFTVAWDAASAANLNQLYFAPGDAPGAYDAATAYTTVWKSNLQPDLNVSIRDGFDASFSALLRKLDESNRFVQKSAKSTSI